MTPRQENSIERSVGRIEAQNEAMAETLTRLVDQFGTVHEASQAMKADIAELKRRADLWAAVTVKFDALEQSIHDKKMQLKGVIVGVGIAGGAAGATAATGIKWAISTFWGAP